MLATQRRRTIPVIMKISDLNDNSPQFLDTPYSLSLAEDTKVGARCTKPISFPSAVTILKSANPLHRSKLAGVAVRCRLW